ncbi:hypothetical protein IRJ41_011015 [Triplophysa rosa]|uniref:CCHC-type domain-containing protein n=1 Tax=Triplophysa rosa TaxID=992332 RepID=A0A9W7WYP0_TRIRA|nr:hypothetical protein IRJ41_011015 [Triplophysa rosa]
MTSHSESELPVGHGSERRSLQSAYPNEEDCEAEYAPLSPAYVSCASTPIIQPSYSSDLVLQDEWPSAQGCRMREDSERCLQPGQLYDTHATCTEMENENEELHSCVQQLPEILAALQGIKAENAIMKLEIQQISSYKWDHPRKDCSPYTSSTTSFRQITGQMRDGKLSPRHDQPQAPEYHTSTQRPSTHPYQYAEAVHNQHGEPSRDTCHPNMGGSPVMPGLQEKTYQGSKPSIPTLTTADPIEFSRLSMALENLLPVDATERFKRLLGADSYCKSTYPYTNTMQALIKMYGQQHKLVLPNTAEVMDGPNTKTGDVKAFKLFSLRLGPEGTVELDCGSHVSRLQSKLPYELWTSSYIHQLRVTIPSLFDFSDWLEYELQVQDDGCRMIGFQPETSIRRKEGRSDPRSFKKSTSILMGAENPMTGSDIPTPAPEVTHKAARAKGRLQAYCPYCDNDNHFLNGCANFKEISNEQKQSWLRKNNRCWCCGRGHHASKCNLKVPCKMFNKPEVDTREHSCLVNTTKDILYADRPVHSRKVLLKVSKVVIANGEKSITNRFFMGRRSHSLSPITNQHKKFHIQGAFTVERLGLAEQTYPVASLKKRYRHLAKLPLQPLDEVQLVLLIGSDCPHLVTPIEPVRLRPPGPTHEIRHGLNSHQCLFTAVSTNAELFDQVKKLWQMDVTPYQRTMRVNVDRIRRYATPLLCVQNMPDLHMPKEAVLPQLRSIDRKLLKNPEQACAYKAEIERLKDTGYALTSRVESES